MMAFDWWLKGFVKKKVLEWKMEGSEIANF